MRYLMTQKLFSFGNDFAITDELGREAYFVDGKAFSFGNKLSFKDRNRNEVAFISQKLMSLRPAYSITSKGIEIAKVKKALLSFRDRFIIDVPGPDDITIVGRLIEHEYKFYRNKSEVASVSKKFFQLSDTYGIEIHENKNEILFLACAVVIDLMCHNKKS